MKRSVIALLLLPLLVLCVFLAAPERDDHVNSPAFSVALNQAIDKLEGTAGRVTSAATPVARAGALDYTTDPVTCFATNPECQELTYDERPCNTLDHGQPTCDHESPTCDASPTCHGRYTCDYRTTCDGSSTCNADYTCWNSTCEEQNQTCDGETPTCDAGANCNFTTDGTHTCNGSATCDNTCQGWPTCSDYQTCDVTCAGQPTCDGATCSGATCEGATCEGATCEGATCDATATCDGNETCDYTCDESIWPECGPQPTWNSGFTCDGSNTCDNVSPTCVNTCSVWPTCQANPACGITFDGTATCDGTDTCMNTCIDWPTCSSGEITCEGYPEHTCDPKNPDCCNATEHTSWGKLKKMAD